MTAEDRDHEAILRRALHTTAESIDPAGDGLERIRHRIVAPKPAASLLASLVAWLRLESAAWLRSVLAIAGAVSIVVAGAFALVRVQQAATQANSVSTPGGGIHHRLRASSSTRALPWAPPIGAEPSQPAGGLPVITPRPKATASTPPHIRRTPSPTPSAPPPTATAAPTPTDSATPTASPTPTDSATPTATPKPTDSVAPTPTPTPTDTAAPTPAQTAALAAAPAPAGAGRKPMRQAESGTQRRDRGPQWANDLEIRELARPASGMGYLAGSLRPAARRANDRPRYGGH